MTKPAASNVTTPRADATTRILLVFLGILALGHLITAAAPGIRTWGLDYWSEIPVGVRWLLVGIVALAMLPPVARTVDAIVGWRRWNKWGILVAAAAVFALFIVFRSRALAYGDGYSFSGYLGAGKLPHLEAQLAIMPLDLLVHWALYRLLVLPLGGSVELTYAILSALSGILMLGAIVRIAGAVAPGRSRRLVIAAAVASGTVGLWFGYVEAYSLTNAAGLWALALAIEAQRKPRLLWSAWALWVLACAFHLLALPLALPLAWATWRVRRPGLAPVSRRAAALWLGGGFVACALGSTVLHVSGHAITVPLWETANSDYTAFSIHHLIDALNQALLVAPMGLIGAVVWLARGSGHTPRPGAAGASPPIARGVLAMAAAATWYFAFWVDPFLGAFRDWDLLAGFGFPLSLWGATVIVSRSATCRYRTWSWVPVAALAAAHVGPYVAALQNESQGAMRVDRLVRQDGHYAAGFYRGARLTPWAFLIGKREGRWDIAAEHFRRRTEFSPSDAVAWKNLGAAYQHAGHPDSAAAAYEQAAHRDSNDASIYQSLGLLYVRADDAERARAVLERALALSDTSLLVRNLLAQAYQRLGMLDDAARQARELVRQQPDHYEGYYLLARDAMARNDTAAAVGYLQAAIDRDADEEDVYVRLVGLYQKGKDRELAAAAARRWEAKFPSDPKSSFILGTTYLLLGRFDSANAALSRTVKYAPQDAVATYYLATTFRHLGQPERSRELAQKAARMDTTLSLPWLELIYLADDAHDRAAAAAATREYLRRAPADSVRDYFRQFLKP